MSRYTFSPLREPLMTLLLILVVLILLFGGGGAFYNGGAYQGPGFGLAGVLVIFLILYLLGVF